jgi:hypothetical protein
MREKELIGLKEGDFKRLTGVRRETFERMRTEVEGKAAGFGRPPKLESGDQVLMTLMYWREYRTLFHIGKAYGISESQASRIVRKVEDILVSSGQFRLPGKKTLQPSDLQIEVVLVDATEQPIERPKKSKNVITAAKRSGIPKKLNS